LIHGKAECNTGGPFTAEQRRDVARVYESFRSHVRMLRKAHPPLNHDQRRALRQYEDHVHAVGSELLKVNSLVNVSELSRLIRLVPQCRDGVLSHDVFRVGR
jgi:hypothetical protein